MSALNPWDIGNRTDINVIIQGVIDKVYLGLGYQVKYGDKIFLMVCLIIQDYMKLSNH